MTVFPVRTRNIYPFKDLEVGDSFTVNLTGKSPTLYSVRCYAYEVGIKLGRKFSTHRPPGEMVLHITRTA